MAKRWEATIETHRGQVREAIMGVTWALVEDQGLLNVTMSRIAEEAGIGRATLYKYFPDVEAIFSAWHQRHVTAHLADLTELSRRDAPAGERLLAVADAYARICYFRERHGAQELGALLHQDEEVVRARQGLQTLFRDLLAEASVNGEIRDDIQPGELANYCLHALAAAGNLPSEAALNRLVSVTLSGLLRQA